VARYDLTSVRACISGTAPLPMEVQEVAVAGVPDTYRSETVKAYIVPKAGMQPTEEEIIAHCRARLAPYKLPKLVEFRAELPKTALGKVLRRMLIAEEQQKLALGREATFAERSASAAVFI
jgi:acyl-CoA synthetase (AMP-forming)/AMP-acid ligase II